jgi:GRAM domain-containing protein 4
MGKQKTKLHLLYRKHYPVVLSYPTDLSWMIQAFWVLWWHNLLLPSLLLRVFYAIIRRKIFPYPTLQELRKRRKEVASANFLGDAVQARLTPSSPFGLRELWRIFKVFHKPKVDKAKNVVKGQGKKANDNEDMNKVKEVAEGKGSSEPVTQAPEETVTVLDDSNDTKQDKDVKRAILQTLSDIVDLHERIKK